MAKEKHLISTLYANYKRRAGLREMRFGLSRREFARLILLDCYLCGRAPSNKQVNRRTGHILFYNGVDRVDNRRGYVKGNVQPCCWRCNYIKAHTDLDCLKNHLEKMVKYLEEAV